MTITQILKDHPVFDGHNDLPYELRENYDYSIEAADLAQGNTDLQTDLPALRSGGVGAQFWSVYVPSTLSDPQAVSATLEQIDCVYRLVDTFSDQLGLAVTAEDVRRCWEQGKIASLLGMEGGHSIDSSLAVLRMMRQLGVAYMTLTHNDNTPWAASATGEPVNHGLTNFGRDVVREMNRIGMLVDLSHVSAQTMHDALDITSAPVIFSHSSCRGVHDHPRNVPDDAIERLPKNGGVQMITFVPQFIRDQEAGRPADIDDVVAHCEHAREVAGVDHIGLGGDFDGIPEGPQGLKRVSDYPNLLTALADRGWSDSDLGKLTSGNIMRVLEEVAG